jgi:hypothetical protein
MTFFDAGHHSKIELTQEEMLTISREISLKFAPNPMLLTENEDLVADIDAYYTYPQTVKDRSDIEVISIQGNKCRFTAKELNAISEEISRNFAPKAAILEPELFLLPVDPHHLYAYWDIGDKEVYRLLDKDSMSPFTLRVYWRPDANPDIKSSNVWFDVTADKLDARLKVRLPLDNSAYSASIGKLNKDNHFDAIASSNIIHVPSAPGRTRITPFQPNQHHPLPNTNSPMAPIAGTPVTQTDRELVDKDSSLNTEINGIFYEKQNYVGHFPDPGWFVKFHFGTSLARQGDMTKIDSKLMGILNQKGIDVELIPELDFVEPSKHFGKSASGWGM